MVAIPVGFDQPGVAARIAYHWVGEFIEVGNLTTRRLSDLIAKIAENPKYRDKASWFQKVLSETRGLEVAADIVERAFEDRFEDKFRSRMLATSSAEETSFLP
jgi:zeaxanthin glucosyltransferase